jgi:hypothetical protein
MKRILSISFFMILVAVFFISCASTEQRAQTLESKYPDWNKAMLMKVAARQVEPGMNEEMVIEAMSRRGQVKSTDEPGIYVWIYYKEIARGMSAYWAPAFWVYFKKGIVVRTAGDRFSIGYW